jgi:hypothetical protein
MIQFYKPNGKNTGAACSFWYSPDKDAFFSNIIKQASWNAKSRTGSFLENKKNREKNVLIKLNLNEIGGILDCLENNREFSAYHSSPQANHITKMKFAKYVKEDEQLGFIFMASKEPKDDPSSKLNFSIALNFGEAKALQQCLLFMMNSMFTDKIDKIKSKAASRQKTLPSQAPAKKATYTQGDSEKSDEIVF